jgi:hypothetical protein
MKQKQTVYNQSGLSRQCRESPVSYVKIGQKAQFMLNK